MTDPTIPGARRTITHQGRTITTRRTTLMDGRRSWEWTVDADTSGQGEGEGGYPSREAAVRAGKNYIASQLEPTA